MSPYNTFLRPAPNMRDSSSGASIPKGGHFFGNNTSTDTAEEALPSYDFPRLSMPVGLAMTDCHEAILAIARKARLMIFEVAKNQPSLVTIEGHGSGERLFLNGTSLKIDLKLAEVDENLSEWLKIFKLVIPPGTERDDLSTEKVIVRLVQVRPEFRDANAKLKQSLLGIEKDFEKTVIQPLKRAIIDERELHIDSLYGSVVEATEFIGKVIALRSTEVEQVILDVQQTEPWKQVMVYVVRFRELCAEADSQGFVLQNEPGFPYSLYFAAFETADGPDRLIAHAEKLLASRRNSRKGQSDSTSKNSVTSSDSSSQKRTKHVDSTSLKGLKKVFGK